MLSAVAARKLARQQQQAQTTMITTTTTTTTLPLALPLLTQQTNTPPPKRKSSSSSGHDSDPTTRYPPSKRKRKGKVAAPRARPAHTRPLSTAFSNDSGSEVDLDLDLAPLQQQPRVRRRWSPSALLTDSSDDEQSVLDVDITAPVHTNDDDLKPKHVSTFRPLPSQNMWPLSIDEIGVLRLKHDHDTKIQPGVLLALCPNETLCTLGIYTLSVLRGSVSLCGATVRPSRIVHKVYAPRCTPLPVVEALGLDSSGNGKGKWVTRLPENVRSAVTGHSEGGEDDRALVLIQELQGTGVEGLGRICRTFEGMFELPRMQQMLSSEEGEGLGLQGVHLVHTRTKDVQTLEMPRSWVKALASAVDAGTDAEAPVHLIKGPKKTGKSTFARTLLNSLLSRYPTVAYLECDLGQSEFTPGGMVALSLISSPFFGPPFTHPTLPPYGAHYVGAPTPRSTPALYLEAVRAVVEKWRGEVQGRFGDEDEDNDDEDEDDGEGDAEQLQQHVPLIVNTMGWTKGLGADLTKRIEEMVSPSDIYEIEDEPSFDTYRPYYSHPYSHPSISTTKASTDTRVRMHHLQPAPHSIVLHTKYTPADFRALGLLSYLHAVFPSPTSSSSVHPRPHAQTVLGWDAALPLLAHLPYEVSFPATLTPSQSLSQPQPHESEAISPIRKVVLTGAGMEDVVPEEIGRVFNGAVVGLVVVGEESEFFDSSGSSFSFDEARAQTPKQEGQSLGIPYTQSHPPPPPAASTCLGLALVRSVSPLSVSPSTPVEATKMHVLTPLPPALLASVNVLVKGEMELPVWGMLDFRTDFGRGVEEGGQKVVPYLQWGRGVGEGVVGAERRRVRRNLMRRGQM